MLVAHEAGERYYKQLLLLVCAHAVTWGAGEADPGRTDSSRSAGSTTDRAWPPPGVGLQPEVDVSTPSGVAVPPGGMSVLLLGPFPWQLTSLRAAMAMPEVILWWFMFPSMIRGLRFLIRQRFSSSSPLVIFSITLTCAYSLVHGNVGSGFRQRTQVFVFLFIFAALGWYQKRCRQADLSDQLLLTPAAE